MKTTLFLPFIFSLTVPLAASGYHCRYLSAKYATEAFKALSQYKEQNYLPIIDRYCESCSDSYVKPIVIEDIKYLPYQVKGYASLAINGKEVDLAYLYLDGKNLGYRFNCKTSAASEYLFAPKQAERFVGN